MIILFLHTIAELKGNILYSLTFKYDLILIIIIYRFSCKSFGANGSGSLKNAEVKFQSKITKWYQLDTHVDFDQMYPVIKDHESDSLKKQFQNILEDISNKIGSSIVVLEGESMSLDDPVEILGEKKKKDRKESKSNDTNFNNRVLEAVIYIPSVRKIFLINVDIFIEKVYD